MKRRYLAAIGCLGLIFLGSLVATIHNQRLYTLYETCLSRDFVSIDDNSPIYDQCNDDRSYAYESDVDRQFWVTVLWSAAATASLSAVPALIHIYLRTTSGSDFRKLSRRFAIVCIVTVLVGVGLIWLSTLITYNNNNFVLNTIVSVGVVSLFYLPFLMLPMALVYRFAHSVARK